jgi:hypothetical protein
MKNKPALLISTFGIAITGAVLLGNHLAHRTTTTPRAVTVQDDPAHAVGVPTPAMPEARSTSMESIAMDQPIVHATTPEEASSSPDDLRRAMSEAVRLDDKARYAEALASQNTEAAVQSLLESIGAEKEWATRAALAKHLRAVSDPDTLPALVPALLNNYGRGNTILNEIVDSIARMAQPDTIEALATLHWQASTQAGQGHKVLKAVAAIRNPPAMRGLVRLSERAESPALAAAAQEALKRFQE